MEREQRGEIEGAVDAIDVGGRELVLIGQRRDEVVVGIGGDLETHGIAADTLPQTFFDHRQQVLGVLLLERQIGVPGDPKHGVPRHREPAEQLPEMVGDEVLEQDEANPTGGPRDDDHAIEQRRHLDHGEAAARPRAVRAIDQEGDVECFVMDVRKRVPRIDRQWR